MDSGRQGRTCKVRSREDPLVTDDSHSGTERGRPQIDANLVRKTARLARLEIQESEIPQMVEHMEKILDLVADLEIGSDSLHESLSVTDGGTSLPVSEWRADIPADAETPGGPRDPNALGSNAPDWRDGTFVTPRVVGGD